MANTLNPLSPSYWSKMMGLKRFKTAIYRPLASFAEAKTLTMGRQVDRPYRSNLVGENYTPGTALTAQDVSGTQDLLTVDKIKAILFYVDRVHQKQNKWSAVNKWSSDAGERLFELIDAEFLYEVTNANNTIDAAEVGGTAGDGVELTAANIPRIFGAINRKLNLQNVPRTKGSRFFAISAHFEDKLWEFLQDRESRLGDVTGETGMIGRYAGLDLFQTNNSTASARWTPADNPSNTATVTIEGITFTFVSSIGTTAGNILQDTSTAVTIDNLVALINAGGVGDGVSYVSLTTANQRAVQQWVAVDGTTYIEVYVKGGDYLTVSTSEAADVWNTGKQLQHLLAGRKKAIDMVVQINPDVDIASTVSAGKAGHNVLALALFGLKTFNQELNEIANVKVKTANFV